MLRYLPGLVMVQLVVLALYVVNAGSTPAEFAVRVALPALIVTLVTALWFGNLARLAAARRHADLVERHAREREQLKVSAVVEREKVKGDAAREREKLKGDAVRERDEALDKLRRDARRAERRSSRAASLKIGGAYLAATGLGVLFLFSELLTLGLLTITTSGGALAGYLVRWRQTREVAPGNAASLGTAPGPAGTDAVSDIGQDVVRTVPKALPRSLAD